ncbi:MAG: hypothetical protein J6V24_00180, partial [Clostridia bacterium]|nr:hypothetical protein [Clostridia bacterium]
ADDITLDEWMENNADSDDIVTAAVYKYLIEKEEYLSTNPDLLSASYNVEYDEGLKELQNLGTSRLVEIYSKINENSCINSVLMNAITEILGIQFLTPTNRRQDAVTWMEAFEDLVKEAYSTTDFSDENILTYGLLLLPAVKDQGASLNYFQKYSEQETEDIRAFIRYVAFDN